MAELAIVNKGREAGFVLIRTGDLALLTMVEADHVVTLGNVRVDVVDGDFRHPGSRREAEFPSDGNGETDGSEGSGLEGV